MLQNNSGKMWLYMCLCCAFASIKADDQNTTMVWNSTTMTSSTPLVIINTTSELSNSSTTDLPLNFNQMENDTDISNFIAGIDYNTNVTNSTYLEHFTKFNWTVLDSFDNTFGGTDDISVKDQAENVTGHVESINNNSRIGHERNLMVVLPVMQGNSDLSNSNLQVLYTKPPVTAIIGGERKEERKPQEPSPRTTIKLIKTTETPVNNLERIDRAPEAPTKAADRQDSKRHPYTEFLFNKPPSKPKSPLDYGYPDTFKFIEDFNELPKNHRPDWAVPDIGTTAPTKKPSTMGVTRRDPFQMFESVKPLEINKLLSFKPIPVTDSITEQTTHGKKKQQFLDLTTEFPSRPNTKRPKRPGKKPQKNKTTVLTKFIAQYTPEYSTLEPAIPSPSVEDMYTAAKYTNLLSRTTAAFLPTPYKEPMVNERTVKTTTPRFLPEEPSSTTSMIPESTKEEIPMTTPTTTSTSTTTTTTTEAPTTSRATTMSSTTTTTTTPTPMRSTINITTMTINTSSTFFPTTECSSPDHKKHQIKPSDLINLKKILDEEFGIWPKPSTESSKTKDMPSLPFSGDMLTSDMKNMLVALGILKSDGQTEQRYTTTPSTTNNYLEEMFMKRDPVKPTIDPHSYVSFKKIPIDFAKPSDKLAVSDEMKDLLASFGLIPKNPYAHMLTRMTRQHKMIADVDSASSASNDSVPIVPSSNKGNISEPMESLDTLTPQPFNYQPHENGHVFHPTVHLEKLGDERKLRTINHVIDAIKLLSKSENASEEEVQQHLESITSLIKNDNSTKELSTTKMSETTDRITPKIKSDGTRTTIDLKTNLDYNFNSDESSVVLNTFSGRNNFTDLTQIENAPNPLSSEELQQLFEANKNEVKRQQPSNTTGNAPLSDLAASFGGGETASEAPVAADLPTPKPNGLYFYVDWNTFMNVGESEKNAAMIRFAPRAGNPRNFIPITFP